MRIEEYTAMQFLEDRIYQLKLLKSYMEHFLEGKPFKMEINISVLGASAFTPFPYLNGKFETNRHTQPDPDDRKYIIDAIQKRIDELEKEFNNS